jgi:hypothetical protein
MVLGDGLSDGGQVAIDGRGGLAAFTDSPDYQRLSATHVAGGKDILD